MLLGRTLSSEAPIQIDSDGDDGGKRNSVDENVAPVCAFRDGSEVPGIRDNGAWNRFFEGWDDGRMMIEEMVLDVVKECIFHLTEDGLGHLFDCFAHEEVVNRIFDGGDDWSKGLQDPIPAFEGGCTDKRVVYGLVDDRNHDERRGKLTH